MSVDWEQEAPRLARLARLELAPKEAHALALACEAITREFSDLTAYARSLPEPEAPAKGTLRPDESQTAPEAEVEGILAAVPAVDRSSRKVIVPKGLP